MSGFSEVLDKAYFRLHYLIIRWTEIALEIVMKESQPTRMFFERLGCGETIIKEQASAYFDKHIRAVMDSFFKPYLRSMVFGKVLDLKGVSDVAPLSEPLARAINLAANEHFMSVRTQFVDSAVEQIHRFFLDPIQALPGDQCGLEMGEMFASLLKVYCSEDIKWKSEQRMATVRAEQLEGLQRQKTQEVEALKAELDRLQKILNTSTNVGGAPASSNLGK